LKEEESGRSLARWIEATWISSISEKESNAFTYISGSRGLDQDRDGDGGGGGCNGAREASGGGEGAEVLVVSVDNASEVATNDGQLGTRGDWGAQDTGSGGGDALADAERVGGEGEGSDGQLRGDTGSSAAGEGGRLSAGNSGKGEGGDGSEELHGLN